MLKKTITILVIIIIAILITQKNEEVSIAKTEDIAVVEEVNTVETLKEEPKKKVEPKIREEVVAEITAYTASVDETDDTPNITASGKVVGPGMVACPYKYKFGTRVMILGKIYTCEDRMSRKYPDRFDIFVGSKQEAYNFGIKTLTVKILL